MTAKVPVKDEVKSHASSSKNGWVIKVGTCFGHLLLVVLLQYTVTLLTSLLNNEQNCKITLSMCHTDSKTAFRNFPGQLNLLPQEV